MNDIRWNRIEDIYHAALERTPEQRDAFLTSACRDDLGVAAGSGVIAEP
jgi:hypothetical protein